jgi:biopolymer transport protein ExbB/TolQ
MGRVALKEIIAAGGVTLLLLAALSVYSIALMWERRSYFRKALAGVDRFLERLRQAVSSGELKEAAALCKQHPGPAASVIMAALVGPTAKDDRRAAAERALARQVALLERGLPALGTVASISPFIGLFGTVLGVMRAFRDLAGASGAGPGVVAVGISEALVGTAAGLFVAIPALVAYNYFTTRANRFAEELGWVADEVLDALTERAR